MKPEEVEAWMSGRTALPLRKLADAKVIKVGSKVFVQQHRYVVSYLQWDEEGYRGGRVCPGAKRELVGVVLDSLNTSRQIRHVFDDIYLSNTAPVHSYYDA